MRFNKQILKNAIKLAILALVVFGIYSTVRKASTDLQKQQIALREQASNLWRQSEAATTTINRQDYRRQALELEAAAGDFWKPSPWRLLLATVLYAVGMVPAAFYWKRCLSALGQQTGVLETLWAYFLGNLGKYFPGKAMVLVLRIAALEHRGVKKTATAITIFMETLTMMAVGGAFAAVSLIALNLDFRLTLLAVGLLTCTFLPTCPPVLRRVLEKLQRGVPPEELSVWTRRLSWRLTLQGWCFLTITWLLMCSSLFAVVWSLPSSDFADASSLTLVLSIVAACSLAVVLGFVSLIPGGAGVRELVLSIVLTPVVGPVTALCTAVWMRVVWLATELLVVGVLKLVRQLANSRNQMSDSNPGSSLT